MTPSQKIRNELMDETGLPRRGASMFRKACEALGYDPREIARNPTDEQAEAVITQLRVMDMDGTTAADAERNRKMAAADRRSGIGDGAQMERGHTWGDELGTEGHPSDGEPTH